MGTFEHYFHKFKNQTSFFFKGTSLSTLFLLWLFASYSMYSGGSLVKLHFPGKVSIIPGSHQTPWERCSGISGETGWWSEVILWPADDQA